MFTLEEGQIALDPDNNAPESISAGIQVADFSATVVFDNPINASYRDYSHGIKFRESEDEYHAVTIHSSGEVRYLTGVRGPQEDGVQTGPDVFTVIETFDYEDVLTRGPEANSLHLAVIEDKGWLYVNDQFIKEFPVGGIGIAADVQLVAELENETQISGAFTGVSGVEIRSAQPAMFLPSARLVKEQGEIARTGMTGTIRDFMVESQFISPYERILDRWSVGFELVEPVSGVTHWVVFNNSKQWKHLRSGDGTVPGEELAAGTHVDIFVDRGDINQLRLVGRNGTVQVYINGTFISTLNIDPMELPAHISAFAGLSDEDQKPGYPTQLLNHTVWSLGS